MQGCAIVDACNTAVGESGEQVRRLAETHRMSSLGFSGRCCVGLSAQHQGDSSLLLALLFVSLLYCFADSASGSVSAYILNGRSLAFIGTESEIGRP